MWPELILIYLFALKVRGYREGDPLGAGLHGSLMVDMARHPPKHLTGSLITPESLMEIALVRMIERINYEKY